MTMPSSTLLTRAHDVGVGDDSNPAPKPKRRQFSAEYKLGILAEYDGLSDPGARGALLRREGRRGTELGWWRSARARGSSVPTSEHDRRASDGKVVPHCHSALAHDGRSRSP
jgi:transposase